MALASIVVSDSTTLITLINIKRIELLFLFADHVVITPSIYKEVSVQNEAKQILDKLIDNSAISIQIPSNHVLIEELLIRLDIGESEAIGLCLQNNTPLVIDEKKGRNIAKGLGIHTTLLVGILLALKKKSILTPSTIVQLLDELDLAGFRISTELKGLLRE